jgi:hypothetical protein
VERGNAKIILTDQSNSRLIHKKNQMNNVASILLLVFLAISFLQSGYDKLLERQSTVDEGHFKKAFKKSCAISFSTCSRVRINIWNFMHCGLYQLVNNGRVFGFMVQYFLV